MQIHSNAILERFETTENQQLPFRFALMHIIDFNDVYTIDQDSHMSKIEQIPFEAEFSMLVSMRMKLVRLVNTRPDIVFEISQIVQITQSMYEKYITKHWKRENKAIANVRDNDAIIRIPKHDCN